MSSARDSHPSPQRFPSPNESNTDETPSENLGQNEDVPTQTTEPLTAGLTGQNERGNISSFVFMMIMLFMLMNGGGDDTLARDRYRESLSTLRSQQTNFSSWLWGSGNVAVNSSEGANFTLPRGDKATINLAKSIMTFGVPLNPSVASYYSNITGFLHGPIEIHNLTSELFRGNVSGLDGAPTSNSAIANDKSRGSFAFPPQSPSVPPLWAKQAIEFIKDINVTAMSERIGSWNWGAPAKLAFRAMEKQPAIHEKSSRSKADDPIRRMNATLWSNINLMHGRVELSDINSGDELAFDMEAVHFVKNGTMYGFMGPLGQLNDIRLLPSLVPSQYMNATAQAVNAELINRIDHLQRVIDSGTIDADAQNTGGLPKCNCSFVFFGQLIPTSVPLDDMVELEDEMENPTGITTVPRPRLEMNAVFLSRECGIVLEARAAEGLKSQSFWRKVTTYSAVASFVYLALLILYVRQAEASQTPSGISRVSRWTFLTQAAADSISFVGHITFGILAEGRPSLSLIALAFFASILLIYEAQFSILIHQIQQPEEGGPSPPHPNPHQPASPGQIPSTTDASGALSSGNPAGQVAHSTVATARATLLGIWRGLKESPQARFWLSMVLSLALFVRVLVSPSLALIIITGVYSNFWFPQIVRSVRRGMTSGLRLEYLVGTTACRSFFALYLFACPNNVLGVNTTPWVYYLIGSVFLQVGILMLQEYLGPAFFLPRSYTPSKQYDYHPYIPLPDMEAPEPSLGDCAICMDAIHVQADYRRSLSERSLSGRRRSGSAKGKEKEKERERGVRGIFGRLEAVAGRSTGVAVNLGQTAGRRAYALAPCSHLFHTACLERWLAIKNICPQCRRPLPPL